MQDHNLTGNYLVRVFRPAFEQARKWCPHSVDRAELRRHALKLRYWPARHPQDSEGQLLDHDWSWIKALHGLKVGELRISDTIGGNNKLRVVFFVGEKRGDDPLPTIWILSVPQKKRNDLTTAQVKIFKAARQLVIARFYTAA